MKVAVVILNWNTRNFLDKFLPKVNETLNDDSELIVADNASKDGSVQYLKLYHPNTKLIQLNKNHGYAGGYNNALKQIDAKYYVLLNSDVEVTPGWLEPVIAVMDSDTTIAACQPKILAHKDKISFEYAGAAGGFIDKYGYPFCRGRIFHEIEKDHQQYDTSLEVFWASGACMFVRADAFHEAGGFDADFFAHMEEIDLCWRLKRMGKKIVYVPESKVYHVGGGTLAKGNPRKTFLNFRNNLSMLYKNLPLNRRRKVIFARLFLDGLAGLKFILSGDINHAIALVKAHWSFFARIADLKKKRLEFEKISKNYSVEQIYSGNIVRDFYIRGKKYFSLLGF